MEKKDFSAHLSSIYCQGLVMTGIGLGYEMGLIQLMCQTSTPMSPQQMADKLNLKERYTREWLCAMATAKIIHLDRETGLFHVPESHREELQLRASFAPALFSFGRRKDMLKNCFKKDGPYGYEYEEDNTWFDWFDGYRATTCDHTVDVDILPQLREQGVISKLESGVKVVDIGSGTGSYTLALAKRFPKSHFTGLEYAQRGITMSEKALAESNLQNVEFVKGNALDLPESWTGSFDWVFLYDTLHDLPDPEKSLEEIHRVLKPDGTLSIVEMGFHSNPADNMENKQAAMYYMCSMFVCLPSSMSAPPHVGYGACWGMDTLKKMLLDKKFNILKQSSFASIGQKIFVLCSK